MNQDSGLMNHLYESNARNVYKYNNVRHWVDINLLDYDYVCIPTNNNKLDWVLFVIVPTERRVECYDSIYDANGFHYESLNVIIKFIKDYQVSNKLPVDDWVWSAKNVSQPKQKNNTDGGVFVCIRMYFMMKGWDLNSVPVVAYNFLWST
jgi:Ulp1 family protease